jgi:phage terminase large subunit
MKFKATTALRKIAKLDKKIRAIQGGTSSSKTISILLYLIDKAQRDKEPTLTSIISESLPHLKRGVIRDFKNIMKGHGYWKELNWSQTDKIYTFETGSTIEFFSADDDSKLRGGRRDRAFINECNNIKLEAFDEIEVRTKEFIFLDWNPVSEFWFYTDILNKRNDVNHIILTYVDNEGIPEEIKQSIEQRRNRASWWRVYGLGQLGEVEGRIYTGWTILDSIPEEARLERRGLDYGYTNDPTAIVDIYKYNSGYLLDEKMYRKGLNNKTIADILLGFEDVLTVADSSEPKSNDEIRGYGVNIVGAVKGQGSVNQGIQLIQGLPIFVTKRSINLIKEYRNYLWATDKEGKIINTPEGGLDHALDAVRYAIQSLNPHKKEPEDISFLYQDDTIFSDIGI